MSIIAKHIAGVRGSETKAMTARAAALRSQGRSIITLSQGEPDFETPSHVRAAACRAIHEGQTRYTAVAGIQPLRESIVAKLERDNGLHFTPDQVTVGCGAKQVIFNAWLASLDPGDEVIIPTPCWVSYPEMVRLAGGSPVLVSTVSDGFRLSPAALERALTPTHEVAAPQLARQSDRRRLLGRRARGARERIGALAQRLGSDGRHLREAHVRRRIVRDHGGGRARARRAHAHSEWTLQVARDDGLARRLWRGPDGPHQGDESDPESIDIAHQLDLATRGDRRARRRRRVPRGFRAEYQKRRDFVVRAVADIRDSSAHLPQGAFYVYVSCADMIGRRSSDGRTMATDTDLVMYLLEDAGVAVVPGSGFLGSPFFRVSFAAATEHVMEGCSRIAAACERLVPGARQ